MAVGWMIEDRRRPARMPGGMCSFSRLSQVSSHSPLMDNLFMEVCSRRRDESLEQGKCWDVLVNGKVSSNTSDKQYH